MIMKTEHKAAWCLDVPFYKWMKEKTLLATEVFQNYLISQSYFNWIACTNAP